MNAIDELLNDFCDNDTPDARLAAIDALVAGEADRDEDALWREDQRVERAMIEGTF